MEEDVSLLLTVPPGTRRVQAAMQVTKRECSSMQKSYGWAHKWDSPKFLQQKLFKQRTSGRIKRNRKKFAMVQVMWQPCPDANTYVMSKAAQLLRTQTTFSLGLHLCHQLHPGPQVTLPEHPAKLRAYRSLHSPWKTTSVNVHEICLRALSWLKKHGAPLLEMCCDCCHSSSQPSGATHRCES